MATPAVAGAAALLLQEHSTLTPDQVKARLMKSAYKMGLTSTSAYVPHLLQSFLSFYDMLATGSGLMNVQNAINNTDLAPATVGSALSPSLSYNANNPHGFSGRGELDRCSHFSGLGIFGGLGNFSGLGKLDW